MAVVLIGRIQEFVGLSSDTKPSAPPVGSTFRETDTGLIAVYDGTAWQVASEVKTTRGVRTNSSARLTLATPASGKKIRILTVDITSETDNVTAVRAEVWFGTAANLGGAGTKGIAETLMDVVGNPSFFAAFTDGAGPVGSADEDVAIRVDAALVAESVFFLITYREE